MTRRTAFFLALFLLYLAARLYSGLPAFERPRQRDDSPVFIELSKQPLFSPRLWAAERPPAYALFLKATDRSLPITLAFQLALSSLAWGALALVVASFLRHPGVQVFSFIWLLLLSLVPHLAGWDFTLLSESLSLSLFVLFTALGLWLMQAWNPWKAAALVVTGFFLAFVRDTNAWLLLALVVCLLIAVLLGWAHRRVLLLAACFAAFLLLSAASSNAGGRWVSPLINIIGRRVLTAPRSVNILQRLCDMPVSPELMGMRNEFANGRLEALYTDPALKGFQTWLLEQGRSCYPRLLISDPVHSLRAPLENLDELLAFRRARGYFAHAYRSMLPASLEPLFYPVRFALGLWIVLTLAAVAALFLEAWRSNRLWGGFLLLGLTVFPHLFLTWHSEVLEPERHAITVGLQLALSAWILVFLLADLLLAERESGTSRTSEA